MTCFSIFFSDGSVTTVSSYNGQLAIHKAKLDYPGKQPMLASMTGNRHSYIV